MSDDQPRRSPGSASSAGLVIGILVTAAAVGALVLVFAMRGDSSPASPSSGSLPSPSPATVPAVEPPRLEPVEPAKPVAVEPAPTMPDRSAPPERVPAPPASTKPRIDPIRPARPIKKQSTQPIAADPSAPRQ